MGLPIRYNFIADRFNPFTEEYSPNNISDEQHTIPSSSPFYIRTKEVVKQDTPSTIEIWTGSGKTGTQFTEVSSAPAQGEFQVDYKYDSGYIRFNEADANTTIYITYKGIGDVIRAEDVNAISDWLGKNFTPADDHNHDGNNSKVIGDGTISQAKLKTSQGSVSDTRNKPTDSCPANYCSVKTLPGGEYGFWPRLKFVVTLANSGYHNSGGALLGMKSNDNTTYLKWNDLEGIWDYADDADTGYLTKIALYHAFNANSDGDTSTIYAQQKYITASGKDHWIFVLRVKKTGIIRSVWQAPDHPCCGQGRDEEGLPHPFEIPKDEKGNPLEEVILIDNEILNEIKPKITRNRDIATIITEEYEIDMASKPTYETREIIEIDEWGDIKGKSLGTFKTPDWAKIRIRKDTYGLKRREVKKDWLDKHNIKYKRLKTKE